MGFFNSNKNRMESIAINRRGKMRSPRSQNRRIVKTMMYNNNARYNDNYDDDIVTNNEYMPSFTEYAIINHDCMIVGDIIDMLPNYLMSEHYLISNNTFENIKCEKVGLVYSPKLKKYLYLALNNDYSCFILFMENNYNDLPNIENIDIDFLKSSCQIIWNINRLMNSVYKEIWLMTHNPILKYKVSEIFKR